MEKTKKATLIELNTSWSDVGSWSALWDSQAKDNNNNLISGDVILDKVNNSYVHSASNRLVSVIGVSNLVVVDTQDAILVADKDQDQLVKNIVQKLKNDNRSECSNHKKVLRPWGYYDSIDISDSFQVKRIFVNSGSRLSLQKHQYRSEHWVIVKGEAKVTCGNKIFNLVENQSTYIPAGEIHRLENTSKNPLELIEIQTGSYLGEDDIIRVEDDYKRL